MNGAFAEGIAAGADGKADDNTAEADELGDDAFEHPARASAPTKKTSTKRTRCSDRSSDLLRELQSEYGPR